MHISLKNKTKTIEAFLQDIEWALDVLNGQCEPEQDIWHEAELGASRSEKESGGEHIPPISNGGSEDFEDDLTEELNASKPEVASGTCEIALSGDESSGEEYIPPSSNESSDSEGENFSQLKKKCTNPENILNGGCEKHDEPERSNVELPCEEYEPDRSNNEPPCEEHEPDRSNVEPPCEEHEPDRSNVEPPCEEHEPDRSNVEPPCGEHEPDRSNVEPEKSNTFTTRRESSLNEDEKQYDTTYSKIFVRKLRTSHISKFGKIKRKEMVWNQAHACRFCGKVVTNFSKHVKKHAHVSEVKEILKLGQVLGKRHKVVRAKWDILRNEGDHKHNTEVLDLEAGEIILGRRQHGVFDVGQYGPCPKCMVWLKLDKTMVRHQKICPGRNNEKLTCRELRIMSLSVSGRLTNQASKQLKEEVFTVMTADDISDIAQNDPLIISLGNMWLRKNMDNCLKRKYYTSSRMRDAARLLKNLRLHSHTKEEMSYYLHPSNFDDVILAAFMTASASIDDVEELKSPSTAIKLGYDIKRMVGSKWAQAIKQDDELGRKECESFLKLMEFEWSNKVVKVARTTLQQRNFNKERSLPDPTDLQKLQNAVKDEIMQLDLTNATGPLFRRVVQLAETRLLLYNKRRAGEIDGVRIRDYVRRSRGISSTEEAMKTVLTKLEEKLLEKQELLETRGKYGRGVPIIIPSDTTRLLNFLASTDVRLQAGIRQSNIYLFANSSIGVIRSYDSLKCLCSEQSLQRPEQITSVNMRKYTATISQIFDLSSQQQSWLVNHLGHSMDIHKIHYRQTSGVIERVDIAKLMLMQEYNLTAKYAGKCLSDIKLDELYFDADKGCIEEIAKNTPADLDTDMPAVLRGCRDDDGYIPASLGDEMEKDDFIFDEPCLKKCKKVLIQRRMWTQAEKEELLELFKDNFLTKTTPGLKECNNAIRNSRKNKGLIHKRNWETIKKKVWNMIQKK